MDFIRISIPFTEILTNQNVQNLAMSSLMLGAKVEETENGFTTYTNIKNNDTTYNVLNFNTCAYLLSLGSEIKNYHTYIEIKLSDLVPDGIRDNKILQYENDVAVEIQLTWLDWINVNAGYSIINNKTYISSYAHYAGYQSHEKPDKCLTFTEIQTLINAGYTILSKSQYLNLTNLNGGLPRKRKNLKPLNSDFDLF